MSRLSEIEVFVGVVREGGFTAADALDVSKSYVSKQVSRLEERVGVRLLNRTTRHVGTTPEGQAYFERCAQTLEELDEAERALSEAGSEPTGTLRVTVPVEMGIQYVAPAIADFMAMHPDLSVEAYYTDRKVDLVEEGFDIAVRAGTLSDSSLVVRRLAPMSGYVCASQPYIDEHGAPDHPAELADHSCLLYSYLEAGTTWKLQGPDEEVSVDVGGPLRANNGQALMHAAERGLGLLLSPDFICGPALKDERLVRLLPDWEDRRGGIWALYPHRRHLSAKVREFVKFLGERFDGGLPWR